MINNKKRYKNKKIPLLFLVTLLVGAAIFLYVRQNSSTNLKPSTTATSQESINLEPATEEDKQRAADNKQAITERDKQLQNQAPVSATKPVKPTITYSGQYGSEVEVGAYVPNLFEDGGSCTATFTNGSISFTKSVSAVKNVSSMDCPVMTANAQEFNPKGLWTVTVSYKSTSASGSSDQTKVEVK